MASKKALAQGGFFKKLGGGRYEGKSGKVFDLKQVEMWYANQGKFPGQKNPPQKAPTHFPKPKR